MNLETGKVVVETAIKKTEGMFNKKTVTEATQRFSEYTGEVERTVSGLQDTVKSQSSQILKLNQTGEEAAKKLREAQAQITYQQGVAQQAKAEAQKAVQDAKTELRQTLNKKVPKTQDLGKGKVQTTYTKPRTGFQAEVVSEPGSNEVIVTARLGDGGTSKQFKYNKATKQAETITDTKPTLVSMEPKTKEGVPTVEKLYSDGTKEVYFPNGEKNTGEVQELYKYARDGKTELRYEQTARNEYGRYVRERLGDNHILETTDNQHFHATKETAKDIIGANYIKSYEKEIKNTGYKVKFQRELDDFGVVKPNYNVHITCPKQSDAVSGTIEATAAEPGMYKFSSAEFTMKDGSKIEFYNFRGRQPQAYRIVPPYGEAEIIANESRVQETFARLGGSYQIW